MQIMTIKRRQEMKERGEKRKAERETFKKKLLSAQKRERDLQRLLRERNSFINLVPVAIMAVEDGKIVEINKMVERELGYSSEEMVGRPFIDFFDPDSREAVEVSRKRNCARTGSESI
jgi:PAS domain-containing protein